MPRIDLTEILKSDSLTLDGIPSTAHPEGASYTFPSLNADDGPLFATIIELSGDDPFAEPTAEYSELIAAFCRDADGNEITMEAKMLGPAHQQMVDDGVPLLARGVVMKVVVAAAKDGLGAAEMVVVGELLGEARARGNRASRRAAAKKPKVSSPRAGSSSSRASTAKSTPAKKAAASTRGRKTSAPKTAPPAAKAV